MYFEIAVGAYMVGTWIYHRYIEDHPPPPYASLAAPTVTQGDAIPLVYGRCRVRSPVLAWVGSQRQFVVSQASPPGSVAYFVDMVFVVGIPFYGGGARLMQIYAGDVQANLNPSTTWGATPGPGFPIDQIPHLPVFGTGHAYRSNFWVENPPWAMVFKNDIEQMINRALVEFFSGTPDQVISSLDGAIAPFTDTEAVLRANSLNSIYAFLNDGLDDTVHYTPDLPLTVRADKIPSYRNQMVCTLYHWCNGDSVQLWNYSFEVKSTSAMFSAGWAFLDDADPAAVIYDLLTSPFGKLSLDPSKVDAASFGFASAQLLVEGNGYSASIERLADGTRVIGDILRQIDGVMYEEPTTGKIELHLVRADYVIANLIDINPGNATITEYVVQGWNELMNQVRVMFTDRVNAYADGVAVGQDVGNYSAQGGKLRSIDISYPGVCDRVLAQKLASRELAVASRPQVRVMVTVSRAFYAARPGQVFTLTWPEYGIDHMVVRVAQVNLGQQRKGQITLNLLRDVFDQGIGAFPVTG